MTSSLPATNRSHRIRSGGGFHLHSLSLAFLFRDWGKRGHPTLAAEKDEQWGKNRDAEEDGEMTGAHPEREGDGWEDVQSFPNSKEKSLRVVISGFK